MKINKEFRDRTDIKFGVPQGSVLRPLSSSVDMIDLFYGWEDSNVASYVDNAAL